MKIAINQPFTFPYIGYFQLISAVDKFILYDDVTYMKQSWINRNRILINNKDHFFTIPLASASSFKLIKDTYILNNFKEIEKIIKTIKQAYSKAPYYSETIKLITDCFYKIGKRTPISYIAFISIKNVCNYLGIKTEFEFSSKKYSQTINYGRKVRLFEIIKINNSDSYINLPGGTVLYSKEEFLKNGIKLNFIDRGNVRYKQFNNDFVPWLSIIDVLMFNSPDETRKLINQYSLV